MAKKEVFIWRSLEGFAGFGDNSFRDMQNLAALDAGIGEPNCQITFKQLKAEGWEQATIPDFPFTSAISLRLVSRHAVDVIGSRLKRSGRLLRSCSILGVQSEFFLFKCDLKADCLAAEARFGALYARFEFVQDRIPTGIPFIGEKNERRYLFVDNEFKEEVEKLRLSGIRFECVWSSETGGREYKFVNGDLVLARVDTPFQSNTLCVPGP